MINPDAKPIAHVSPYKRIEIGAQPKQPEPKWREFEFTVTTPVTVVWGAVVEAMEAEYG